MAPRKPIAVMGMGLGGVNLVKNALMLDDNEVTLAQNAVPFSEDGGVSGIRKRDGWQRVVPTGSVTPGSDAGGAILGGFTVDDPLGAAPPDTDGLTGYTEAGYRKFDGTTTVQAPGQGSFPPPNVCYDYLDGFDTTTSSVYPPVPYPATGAYYYGGHESGQILEQRLVAGQGIQVREVARIVGTGVVDDTFIAGMADDGRMLVVLDTNGGTVNGGAWLFYPPTAETIKLPDLPVTERITGVAYTFGRVWVCAGLHLYSLSILGTPENFDTSWTDAATVSDSGITQLLGMSRVGSRLFVGSYIGSGAGTQVLRMYAFTLDANAGTATALTFPTDNTSGPFNGPASVQVDASPAWMIPYPMAAIGDARMYAQYRGSAAAFVQLLGAGAGADGIGGNSLRILSFDWLLSRWHAGSDTNTDDIIGDWFGSTSGSIATIGSTLDGRWMVAGNIYGSSPGSMSSLLRFIPNGVSFQTPGTGSALPSAAWWNQPLCWFGGQGIGAS